MQSQRGIASWDCIPAYAPYNHRQTALNGHLTSDGLTDFPLYLAIGHAKAAQVNQLCQGRFGGQIMASDDSAIGECAAGFIKVQVDPAVETLRYPDDWRSVRSGLLQC